MPRAFAHDARAAAGATGAACAAPVAVLREEACGIPENCVLHPDAVRESSAATGGSSPIPAAAVGDSAAPTRPIALRSTLVRRRSPALRTEYFARKHRGRSAPRQS